MILPERVFGRVVSDVDRSGSCNLPDLLHEHG